jgi:hypothetical protein
MEEGRRRREGGAHLPVPSAFDGKCGVENLVKTSPLQRTLFSSVLRSPPPFSHLHTDGEGNFLRKEFRLRDPMARGPAMQKLGAPRTCLNGYIVLTNDLEDDNTLASAMH